MCSSCVIIAKSSMWPLIKNKYKYTKENTPPHAEVCTQFTCTLCLFCFCKDLIKHLLLNMKNAFICIKTAEMF